MFGIDFGNLDIFVCVYAQRDLINDIKQFARN